MTSSKPAIFFVPGACHQASHFGDAKQRLEALGYQVFSRTLPSTDRADASWTDDREVCLGIMEPMMDKGEEFVVIAHSYGGVPGTAICQHQSVKERAAAGKKGGIRAIIFVAALPCVQRGWGCLKTCGAQWAPYLLPLSNAPDDGFCYPTKDSAPSFYNDVSDEKAKELAALLKPQSQISMTAPMNDYTAADLTIPAFYFICEKDHAVPTEFQHMLCDSIPGVTRLLSPSGHCPYLSIPDQFVDMVDKCIRGEAKESAYAGETSGPVKFLQN